MIAVLISTFVCLVVGAIPVVVIAAVYLKERSFRTSAQKISGTVIALQPGSSYSGGYTTTVYTPIIQFQRNDGSIGTYTSQMASNRPGYKAGQQVDMYYDPRNPEDVHLGSFWSQSPWMIALAIAALVIDVIGIVFYLIIVYNSL